MTKAKKPTILVSSSVYGIEELLERIYALLTAFGYEVWMSHKGTLPVQSNKTAFANCLCAVEECDLFLCIITPNYGSGKDGDGLSITHQEIKRAIELDKPRWLLTHSDVVFARRLLRDLGYEKSSERNKLPLKKDAKSITDLRVIDMYEEAIRHTEPLPDRNGNWVQEYHFSEDAQVFVTAQFSRFQEVERFIKENMSQPAQIQMMIDPHQGEQK